MATRAGSWATKYLDFAAWTQDEFRNLLCGFPPNPSEDTPLAPGTPVPSRTQVADKFIAHYQRKDAKGEAVTHNGKPGGIPLVDAPSKDKGDVFLVAQAWQFRPVLVLKKNKTYRIHMSSLDYQHGFSLQPQNLNIQILPYYDFVITMSPNETGKFFLICNEYCMFAGEKFGHDTMVGQVIVED